jgi:hypothetical protein
MSRRIQFPSAAIPTSRKWRPCEGEREDESVGRERNTRRSSTYMVGAMATMTVMSELVMPYLMKRASCRVGASRKTV